MWYNVVALFCGRLFINNSLLYIIITLAVSESWLITLQKMNKLKLHLLMKYVFNGKVQNTYS